MRIPRFSDLIQSELSATTLKNTSVVIDGKNFLYNIYEESEFPFQFGTEADKLAEAIKTYLKMFRDANVKCYFVFKGGDSDIGKKINVHANHVTKKIGNSFVAPGLLGSCYTQVLDALDIAYVVCEFEAKNACAVLAKKLNCPIISFDIQFCFFGIPYLPCGRWRSNNIVYDPVKKELKCREFNLNLFLRKYSLAKESIALFIVLLDENLFPRGYFDHVLKISRLFDTDCLVKYENILKWLSNMTYDQALKNILRFFYKNIQSQLLQKVDAVLQAMNFDNDEYDNLIAECLLKENKIIFMEKDPDWFKKGVACKRIATPYINLYHYNLLIVFVKAEYENLDNSIMLSLDIIKFAFNLITNYTREAFTLCTGIDTILVDAKDSVTLPTNIGHPFESGWDDIKEKKLFETFLEANSLNAVLEMDLLAKTEILIMITLVYFTRKKSMMGVDVRREAFCIIVCYVMLAVVKTDIINRADADIATRVTERFFTTSRDEIKEIFDRKLVHPLLEFELCLNSMNNLNILCGESVPSISYHKMYNGTFIYKLLCSMLESRTDKETFINELFVCSPSVLKYIQNLINAYNAVID